MRRLMLGLLLILLMCGCMVGTNTAPRTEDSTVVSTTTLPAATSTTAMIVSSATTLSSTATTRTTSTTAPIATIPGFNVAGSDNQYFKTKYESAHYKLYLTPDDEGMAKILLGAGEAAYPALARIYPHLQPGKTSVYVFPTVEAASKLVSMPPTIVPDSSGGSFDTFPPLGDGVKGYNIIHKDSPDAAREIEGLKSFFAHEVGHRFFYYAYPRIRKPVRPNWLDEGVAMYASEQAADTGREYGFRAARQKIKASGPTSLRALDKLQESGNTLELFYGESSTIINYIVGRYGEGGLRSLLEEYNQKKDLNEAFIRALGMTQDDFEMQFANYTGKIASEADDGNEFYMLLKNDSALDEPS